jgi:transposase-like protein
MAELSTNTDQEYWNEGDENYDEDGEEDDEADADAEAEEIARRLRDQLWADINAARANAPTAISAANPSSDNIAQISPQTSPTKEQAVISTMKAILAFAEKDVLVRDTLASAMVPELNGINVHDLLMQSVASGTVPNTVAKPLSHLLVSLARSDVLFSTLRHSNAPAMQLDKGKRKRDVAEDNLSQNDGPTPKRPFFGHYDLQTQVTDAVRIVTQALSAHSATSRPLDPALVASIQLQLHQIFLFAVTSSAGGGPDMNALQEICGLIQVIGVVSGIQIGPSPDVGAARPILQPQNSVMPPSNAASQMPRSSSPVQIGGIGTAVYPCPTCRKSFSRLFSLRTHQRVHGPDRPFSCTVCPASFARAYDLKRHIKVHDKTSWKCTGCDRMFSRPDAIKRHKNSARSRGSLGHACANGAIEEVELDVEQAKTLKDGRHTKAWGDTVGTQTSGVTEYSLSTEDGPPEEGEVRFDVIVRLQSTVMSLHGLLSAHVATTLGASTNGSEALPLQGDPTGSQATLASVIARAQMQNLPLGPQESLPPPGHAEELATGAHLPNSNSGTHQDLAPASNLPKSQDADRPTTVPVPSLSMYGLSDDQALMLQQAIANAASAAQAQAEAEAALEEEDGYEEEQLDNDTDGMDDRDP